jgi:hypothetical protein
MYVRTKKYDKQKTSIIPYSREAKKDKYIYYLTVFSEWSVMCIVIPV